jgi:hypothetical protein
MKDSEWKSLLREAGFFDSSIFIHTPGGTNPARVIVSEKPTGTHPIVSETMIILPTNCSLELQAFASRLLRWLEATGVTAKVATLDDATTEHPLEDIPQAKKYIVSLLEAENPFLHALSEEDFYRVQRLLLEGLGGVWISRGNRMLDPSGDPAYGVTQGLLRCLRNEKPDIRMHEIALSSSLPLESSEAFDLITCAALSIWRAASLGKEPETEVGELDGVLYIPRLVNDEKFNQKLDTIGKSPPPEMQPLIQNNPLRLEIGTPGMLDTLRFVHDPTSGQPLLGDQVEIEVRANGLNFVDIMVSMGLVADKELGLDAAGVVTRVGPDVTTIKPGDRVATFCMGAYRTFLRTPESLVAEIPEQMSYEEAASLPCVYVTAYRALVEVAHLMKGETILIHSAAGGKRQIKVS